MWLSNNVDLRYMIVLGTWLESGYWRWIVPEWWSMTSIILSQYDVRLRSRWRTKFFSLHSFSTLPNRGLDHDCVCFLILWLFCVNRALFGVGILDPSSSNCSFHLGFWARPAKEVVFLARRMPMKLGVWCFKVHWVEKNSRGEMQAFRRYSII